jgi:hypothetical protein
VDQLALITTIGSSSANSLCTVAEADTYLDESGLYDMDAWDALEDTVKEQHLVWAMKIMNDLTWSGWPVYKNQTLFAPRWFDIKEWLYWKEYGDAVAIPEDLKTAQAYIAYDVVYRRQVGGLINPADGVVGEQQVKSFKLFDSLDVTLATQYTIQQVDGTLFAQLLRSQYWPIYTLLTPYMSLFSAIPEPKGPPLEDEVE